MKHKILNLNTQETDNWVTYLDFAALICLIRNDKAVSKMDRNSSCAVSNVGQFANNFNTYAGIKFPILSASFKMQTHSPNKSPSL